MTPLIGASGAVVQTIMATKPASAATPMPTLQPPQRSSVSADRPVRVAVLGCGLIGSRWDEPGHRDGVASSVSLSHAAAFRRAAGARLVGFCDADLDRAQQAARAWDADAAFDDAAALCAATRPDVVVVATPSAVRSAVIAPVLAAGVRTLVIEKPLATTLHEAQALARQLAAHGANAQINYLRHWDPAMQALRQRIAAGELGQVQRLVGLYGKGLANNGSHLIDLAGLLCSARPWQVRTLGGPATARGWAGHGSSDPSIDAQVQYRQADGSLLQLDMLATDAEAFSCFELTLVGTRAICDIRLGGRRIDWRPVQDDPHYPGYRVPGERSALTAGQLGAMDQMAADALALARGTLAAPRCGVDQALATARAVDRLQAQHAQLLSTGPAGWHSLDDHDD